MNLGLSEIIAVVFLQAGMIISPGSDWFLVLRHSSEKGIRNSSRVALGLGLGSLTITLLAIVGLHTLLTAYPILIKVIRYLGVLWLVWQAAGSYAI